MADFRQTTLEVPTNFTPRPHQLRFLRDLEEEEGKFKRIIMLWHRRAGKDVISWVYMVRQAFRRPGVYIYMFPETELAKKVFWNGLLENGNKMLNLIPEKAINKVNMSERFIELLNGSIVYVIGGKVPNKVRGMNAVGLILSEYAWHKPAIWAQVFSPVLAASGGWVIFNSTPDGPNHYYDLYRNVKGNPTWYISEVKNSETKIVTPEQIRAFIESGETTEEGAIQEYECEFLVKASGSFFGDQVQQARSDGRVGQYGYNPNKRVDTYWDIGFRDATTVWFVQRDGSRYNIIDYYEGCNLPIRAYYDMLRTKGEYIYGVHFLPHDGVRRNIGVDDLSTTQQMFEALICEDVSGRMGRTEICPKPFKKIHAINGTRSMFHSFCFNAETTEKGLRKLALYKQSKNNDGGFSINPKHDENSHAADSFMNIFLARDMIGPSGEYLGGGGEGDWFKPRLVDLDRTLWLD